MADVLRVAGSFAGHDRTQTQSQAPVALGAGQKTGAGMGAVPTEPEMGKRCGGILTLEPAWVLPRVEAEQIRKRPPLRPVNRAGNGGDLDIYAPAFTGAPGGIAEQRGAGSGWGALGRVVWLGAETGPGSSEDPGWPGSGAAPEDAAPLPVPGYGIGQVFGIATGGALELSVCGAGAASEVSVLTCAVSWAGGGAMALGGGSLATRRTNYRPGGGLRIGSPETAAGAPSYQLSRPRAVAEASKERRIRSDVGNDASADCRASCGRSKKELAPEPDSPSAGTATDTGGTSSPSGGEDGAGAESSMAASVVSSEDGESTGFGAGTGVETGPPAAC